MADRIGLCGSDHQDEPDVGRRTAQCICVASGWHDVE